MKRFFYRLYLLLVFLPIFLVATLLTALITAIGCWLGGVRTFSYYPGKIWSRLTLALLLCPVEVRGKEHIHKDRPCLVTPNHTSALDIFLLYGYMGVPFKWVMKGSLRRIPFVGWACEKCGFIFIDRSSATSAKEMIQNAEAALEEGYYIFIFPEGSRTKDGTLGRFKKGAFHIAQATATPILPITIQGGYEAYPRHATFPTPHKLILEIHPQVNVTDYSSGPQGLAQLADEVRHIVALPLS